MVLVCHDEFLKDAEDLQNSLLMNHVSHLVIVATRNHPDLS
jgi:hypothetical protein